MQEQSIREFASSLSFLDLPIGVYVVTADGHFIDCNRPVRQLLALPLEGPVDASIADFYVDPRLREELLKKARAADERGAFLEKEIIPFRVNDRELYLEGYCKPLRDAATREIVGYVGCLVDVTEEHQMSKRAAEAQRKMDGLTADIGKVWHASTSTFVMAKQTLDGVIEALGPSPFGERAEPQPEEIDELLLKQAAHLANLIERFMKTTEEGQRLKALPETRWQVLNDSIGLLREVRERVPLPELRVPTLRKTAHEVVRVCREARAHHLPRELIREVHHEAGELEQLVCLFDAMTTRSAVIQMELPFSTLRDFITTDVRFHETKERLAIKPLVDEAIKRLADFAESANVDIQRRDRDQYEVEGNKRDLIRVFANLLHNAIKYTWKRDRTRASWVEIRTFLDGHMVCIQFENWGVPIAREEIDQRLIFELGYRGKWATDRGRLGTGIGLTDADHVARAHGGEIHVESKPAAPALYPQDEEHYHRQPFITTVTLCLPEWGKH